MNMKTRIIQTKIWIDSYFLELPHEERLLFLYYLTNSHVNIIHLYECPNTIASMETGLPIEIIIKAKIKFEDAKKVFFFKNYVYLKNASKYESYTGEMNEKAKGKLFNELATEVIDWYKAKSNTPINTPLTPSIIHNSKHKTYKSEQYKNPMNENINPEDIPI